MSMNPFEELLQMISQWPAGEPGEGEIRLFMEKSLHPASQASLLDSEAHERLIVYGTLAPGEINHHWLSSISGKWAQAEVPGKIDRSGTYPFFFPGRGWEKVQIFESTGLPTHYRPLDRFEGREYQRIFWPVLTPIGWRIGQIYAATRGLPDLFGAESSDPA